MFSEGIPLKFFLSSLSLQFIQVCSDDTEVICHSHCLYVLPWKKAGERPISCFLFLFLWLTGLILLPGVLELPIIPFKVGMKITSHWLPAGRETEFCCCFAVWKQLPSVRNTSVMITRLWIYNRIANGVCIWFDLVKTVWPLTELTHKQLPFELLKETLKWVH